jgi:hypothetical protein
VVTNVVAGSHLILDLRKVQQSSQTDASAWLDFSVYNSAPDKEESLDLEMQAMTRANIPSITDPQQQLAGAELRRSHSHQMGVSWVAPPEWDIISYDDRYESQKSRYFPSHFLPEVADSYLRLRSFERDSSEPEHGFLCFRICLRWRFIDPDIISILTRPCKE